MIVYFRADANQTIATGHIMRCCAIASEFKNAGHIIKFILADTEALPLINNFEFDYYVLNTKWNHMESELNLLSDYLLSDPCDLFFVDSYYVSKDYFNKLHNFTKLAYLDDLCLASYDIDYIINYAIYAKDMDYNLIYPASTIKLLGTNYIPLRKSFQNIPSHIISPSVENILILTGGSDNYHFALNFLKEAISSSISHNINIVCGAFSLDLPNLHSLANNHSNIKIHVNVNNIEHLMSSADIAISAGGSTTYELAACGTPTITYSLADNQLQNVEKWDSLGLMDYSGDIRNHYSFKNLISMIEELSKNYDKRKKRSALLQDGTINPLGAKQLVKSLETCMANRTI